MDAKLELAPTEELRPIRAIPEGRAANTDDFERVVTGLRLRHRCGYVELGPGGAGEMRWIGLVDAGSGELLELRPDGDQVGFVPATGRGYFSGTKQIQVYQESPTVYRMLGDLGSFSAGGIFQSSSPSFGDGLLFSPSNGIHSVNGQTAGVDCYNAAKLTVQMFGSVMGRNGPDGLGTGVVYFLHWPSTIAIFSFGSTGTPGMNIGYASLTPDPKTHLLIPLTTTDIIAHELGHFFFDSQVYPFPTPEDGASTEASGLNDATGDIVGFLTELVRDSTGHFPPVDIDTYSPTADNFTIGEGALPQPRSMISPVEPFWRPDLTQNLTPPEIIAGPIDRMFLLLSYGCHIGGLLSCGDVSSPGIKPSKAAMLWQCVVAKLAPGATFATARDLAMDCALKDDGHYGGPETVAAANAFYGIHVGAKADDKPPTATLSCHQDLQHILCSGTVQDAENPGKYDRDPQLSIDGVPVETTNGWNFTTSLSTDHLTSGAHTVTLTAWDLWRNQTMISTSVTVDVTSPTIAAFEIQNPNVVTNIHPIHVAAQDASGLTSAEIDLTLNGAPQKLWSIGFGPLLPGSIDVVAPVVFPSDLPDGWYPLSLTVTDDFGNEGVAQATLTVDRTPPSPCEVLVSPYVTPNFDVTYRASDALSGVTEVDFLYDGVKLSSTIVNKGPGEVAIGLFSKQLATPGVHTIAARCVDKFGNAVQSSDVPITVDAPPWTRIDSYGQVIQGSHGVVYRLRATDSDGLLIVSSHVQCSISGTHNNPAMTGGFPTAYDTIFTTLGLVLGETCQIFLYALDRYSIPGSATLGPFIVQDPQQTNTWPCDSDVHSNQTGPFTVSVGKTSGVFDLERNTYVEPDMIIVSCAGSGTVNGLTSYSPGCEGTDGWVSTPVAFSCSSSQIRVQAIPNCASPNQTDWDFVLGCAH